MCSTHFVDSTLIMYHPALLMQLYVYQLARRFGPLAHSLLNTTMRRRSPALSSFLSLHSVRNLLELITHLSDLCCSCYALRSDVDMESVG